MQSTLCCAADAGIGEFGWVKPLKVETTQIEPHTSDGGTLDGVHACAYGNRMLVTRPRGLEISSADLCSFTAVIVALTAANIPYQNIYVFSCQS